MLGDFVDNILSRLDKKIDIPNRAECFESIAMKVKLYYGIAYDDFFIRRRSEPCREARLVLIYLASCYADI